MECEKVPLVTFYYVFSNFSTFTRDMQIQILRANTANEFHN